MKRLVVDVSKMFHERVLRYARATHRSVQGLVRHVLVEYMRQNPAHEEDGDAKPKN